MRTDEPETSAEQPAPLLARRLREVHAEMLDAVLSGDRMRDVAAIAARRSGAPVAVIIPELSYGLVEPATPENEKALGEIVAHVARWAPGVDRVPPASIELEVPVNNGGAPIGTIAMLSNGQAVDAAEAHGVLHLAAMAAMTDLALVESRQQVEDAMRGSFLEELRAGAELDASEVVRRASKLGCDLTRGALILAGDPEPERVHRFMAAIKSDLPNAFVQRFEQRVYAVLAADADSDDGRDRVVAFATVLARRLQAHAPVSLSSFFTNPGELGRAIREADLILDVTGGSDLPPERLSDGTYRLLMQLLGSHPDQLDAFYEETVAPLIRYDERYRTELVATLAAYLDHDCRMKLTAEALFAHRHTVAYRLERIRDLTGLDLARADARERLSIGLKIHQLTAGRTL